MEWTGLNELREKYLSFFESKGHLRLESFSLIPQNDPSLLLINSGMAPMKKFFTGEAVPPRKRVTTCQKCIRTPDLERVGHTARHGTFFEMLGNFSFGDYFKEEAISWAWEFLTVTLEIPADRLYPSVYEKDDESFRIWNEKIGIPAQRIAKLGKGDNFWEHGPGPCGPCSEIYFDRGEKYGCGKPDCGPGCDCDRFMEIWNNVFSQFNNDGNGNYTELKQKNIDTGMGLERLACVMQGVDNLFEVDTVRRILDTVCSMAGVKYGENEKNDISIRVITDHIRSAVFMICDGVTPSNEGRGYVLRRIIRRAARHGKLLGIKHGFLSELCDVVIGENKNAYRELVDKEEYIRRVIGIEESRFEATIDAGLSILTDIVRGMLKTDVHVISGEEAFKLYDTFGFPIDLTREIAEENNLQIDEDTFNKLMVAQRKRAREARSNVSGWSEASKRFIAGIGKTEFTGYTDYRTEATVVAILVENEAVDSVSEGDCTVILDRTPFYAESGGQVGDTGAIYRDGAMLSVTDTKKTDGVYLHMCSVAGGVLNVGDKVMADISDVRRESIKRNHSCCHLLQAALRAILGNHVEQAGSYVDEEGFRFDFAHFAPLTDEELRKVESLVNANILVGNPIITTETDLESAKAAGAMALFGEKYGSVVRMVKMGDFSTELCGGTHMDNTAKIGLFKIISESSVAAGVRRIEGVTGAGVLKLIEADKRLINETAAAMKVGNTAEIAHRAAQMAAEIKTAAREIETLEGKLSAVRADEIIAGAKEINGFRVIVQRTDKMTPAEARSLGDSIRDKAGDAVVLFIISGDGKINFVAACGKEAVSRGANAGTIVREAAVMTGGKGGGRPESAMAGGKDTSCIDAAVNKVFEIIQAI